MFLGRKINIVKMTILPNAIYRFNAKVKVKSLASNSLQPPGLQPTRLLCPWDSPGKKSRVGCHFLPHLTF